jgi:hypothetical protein
MLGLTLPMGCSPLDWPAAPLYDEPTNDPGWVPPSTVQQAMAAIKGHYAHYDVVAYEGKIQTGTMRTFVVSYGFTDFAKVGNKLIEYDRFCHAEHKINQEGVTTSFNDAATQAIRPRMALVNVYQEDGSWKIWRPATPTLIGIDGNPDLPLSMDPNDPNINDADRDGHPGVTVDMKLGGAVKAQIYIARREVFQSDLTLYSDGTLFGHVVDDSEQLVVGATMAILAQPNNPEQYSDLSLSPIMLIPIPRELDTCEELMANRDALFPPAPEFQ